MHDYLLSKLNEIIVQYNYQINDFKEASTYSRPIRARGIEKEVYISAQEDGYWIDLKRYFYGTPGMYDRYIREGMPEFVFDKRSSSLYDQFLSVNYRTLYKIWNKNAEKWRRWSDISPDITAHNNYATRLKLYEGPFTLEERRKLLHSWGEQRNQAVQLLAFYVNQPYLLKDREHQVYFEQGLLDLRLHSSVDHWKPREIEAVRRFLESQYRVYELFDPLLSSYFLRLNLLFKEAVGYLYPESVAGFLDTRAEVVKQLQQMSQNINSQQQVKRRYFLLYLRTFVNSRESWNSDTMTWYLLSNTYLSMIRHLPRDTTLEQEFNDLAGLTDRLLSSVRQYLQQDQEPLNRVREYFFEKDLLAKENAGGWEARFSNYTSGDHRLDVFNFDYFYQQTPLGSLPENIYNHPGFYELIDWDKEQLTFQVREGQWMLYDKPGQRYIVELNEGRLSVFYDFQEQWVELVGDSEKSSIREKRLSNSGKFSLWSSRNRETVFVLTKKEKELYAQLGRAEGRIYTEADERLFLLDPTYLRGRMLDPDFSMFWGTETEAVVRADYPRFGISVKDKVDLNQSSDGSVYEYTPLDQVSGFPWLDYFASVRKDKRNLLLIPRYYYHRKNSFGRDLSLDIELSEVSADKLAYFEIHLDENGLVARPENRFYLAYLYLIDHQYNKALATLGQFSTSIKAFSQNQLQELIWLLSVTDFDPRAVAIRIHAYAQLKINSLYFQYDIEEAIARVSASLKEPIDLLKLYGIWLSVQENLSPDFYLDSLSEQLAFSHMMPVERQEYLEQPSVSRQTRLIQAPVFNDSIDDEKLLTKFQQLNFAIKSYHETKDIRNLASEYFYDLYKTALLLNRSKTANQDDSSGPSPLNEQYLSEIRELLLELVPEQVITEDDVSFFYRLVSFITQAADPKIGFVLSSVLYGENDTGLLEADQLKEYIILAKRGKVSQELTDFISVLIAKQSAPRLLKTVPGSVENVIIDDQLSILRAPWELEENIAFTETYTPPAISAESQGYQLSAPLIAKDELEQLISLAPRNPAANELSFLYKRSIDAVGDDYTGRYLQSVQERLVAKPDKKAEGIFGQAWTVVTDFLNTVVTGFQSTAVDGEPTDEVTIEPRVSAYFDSKEFSFQFEEAYLEAAGARLKEELSEALKKWPGDKKKMKSRVVSEFAGTVLEVDFKSYLQLYGRRDYQSIFNLNPGWTKSDVDKLLQKTQNFLLVETRRNHIQRVLDSIKSLRTKARSNSLNRIDIESFNKLLAATRSYDITENPDYLVHEYHMGFLLRPEQVEKLKILERAVEKPDQAKGALLEMQMGSGKTSVLLPLLANRIVMQDKLSIIIMPESLIPSVAMELDSVLGASFKRFIDVIRLDRARLHVSDEIKLLRKRIEWNYQHRRILMLSNTDIQTLFLIFFEHMKAGAMENVEDLAAIFRLFREKSVVTIDEADQVLNIMQSLRFTEGAHVDTDDNIINATYLLYLGVIKTPELAQLLERPGFTEEQYRTDIRQWLVDALFRILSDQDNEAVRYLLGDIEYEEFYSLDKTQLKTLLLTDDRNDLQDYVVTLKDRNLQVLLSTVYRQINSVMPLTLAKIHRVHYGLYPLSECQGHATICPEQLGIPFHNSKPMLTSRFGSLLETLNYTIQASLIEKRSAPMLMRLAQHYKTQLLDNLKTLDEVYKATRLLLSSENMSRLLYQVSLEDRKPSAAVIQMAKEHINIDPVRSLLITKPVVTRSVYQSPGQLKTNSFIYPLVFNQIQGFSGTLWNSSTYPEFFDRQVSSSTLENTLALIAALPEQKVDVIYGLNAVVDVNDRVNLIMTALNTMDCSFIDAGSFFKGYVNEDVAQALIQYAGVKPHFRNIVFYDGSGNTVQYNVESRITSPYLKRQNDPEVTCGFWDTRHTVGSDLKVNSNTVSVVTVHKDTILRDLLQSVWRLRGLNANQKVRFAVSYEDAVLIANRLKTVFGIEIENQQLSINQLVLYLTYNQSELLDKQGAISLAEDMRAQLIGEVFSAAVSGNPYKYDDIQELIEEALDEDPVKSFTTAVQTNASLQHFVRFKESLINSKAFAAIADRDSVKAEAMKDQMESIISKRLKTIKEQIRNNRTDNLDITTEVEVSQEQQQEVEQDEELELELEQQFMLDESSRTYGDIVYIHSDLKDFYIYSREPAEPGPSPAHPFVRLTDAILYAYHPILGNHIQKADKIATLFDSRVFLSLNVSPLHMGIRLWGFQQRESTDLYFYINPATQDLEGVFLLDTTEAHKMKDYNLFRIGFDNPEEWYEEYIEPVYKRVSKEQFYQLLVQAKFALGYITYTKPEKEALTSWFKQKIDSSDWQILEIREVIRKHILLYKQKSKENFDISAIGDAIHQLSKYTRRLTENSDRE